jgi:hypothetical protein
MLAAGAIFSRGAWLASAGVALALAACGSRAAPYSEADGLEAQGGGVSVSPSVGEQDTEAAAGAGGGAGLPPPQRFDFDATSLPPCEQGAGRRQRRNRPCSYRAGGICYEDVTAACACICPRSIRTVCAVSGFLSEPGEPQDVICFGL